MPPWAEYKHGQDGITQQRVLGARLPSDLISGHCNTCFSRKTASSGLLEELPAMEAVA